jgi:serine O-acetyltransferase
VNPQERLVRMMRHHRTRSLAHKGLKFLGVDIPPTVEIGDGLQLAHGAVGLVMNPATKIGNNVKIFQGVGIGLSPTQVWPTTSPPDGRIIIEDDVVLGAGAKVVFTLGQTLTIGRGAIIGPNAVVRESVPPGEVWEGVPARKVRVRPPADDELGATEPFYV